MTKVRVNWGPAADGCPVKLYCVYNTNRQHLYVLASDEAAAMSIAQSANHVYGTEVKHTDRYGRSAYEIGDLIPKMLQGYTEPIKIAISRRLQGSVHVENGCLRIGGEAVDE